MMPDDIENRISPMAAILIWSGIMLAGYAFIWWLV
jgi:hypothetical protein